MCCCFSFKNEECLVVECIMFVFVFFCSVSSPAGEHLPIPGHDHVERSQDDCGWQTRGSHSV